MPERTLENFSMQQPPDRFGKTQISNNLICFAFGRTTVGHRFELGNRLLLL